MRLSRISLTNVGLIASLTIDCLPKDDSAGSVIILRGKNGTGKTTVIRAVRTMFDGGSFPDLIGPNGPECSIDIEFDNGDHFQRVESAKGYTLKGWNADGSVIKSPAKTLQGLASGLSLEPTGLVDAPPKERVKVLQDAMPLNFTRADLVRAGCGVCEACEKGEPLDKSGRWHGSNPCTAQDLPATMDLQKFTAYRDGKYDRRRTANVESKELHATRLNFAKALPEGDILRIGKTGSGPVNPLDAPPTVKQEVADCELLLRDAQKALSDAIAGWRQDYEVLKDEIAKEEMSEIDQARFEFETKCAEIRKAKQAKRADLDRLYETTTATERKPLDEAIATATAALGAAREKLEAESRMEGVRASIAQLDSKITAKDEEALTLDEQVKALDALKLEKLSSQPIPGVEIRGTQIFYNGLNFDTQVNTARQYILSFEVACLTLTEDSLPFFVFDKAESLVGDQRQLFIDGMKEAGFQVLMADADESVESLTVEAA